MLNRVEIRRLTQSLQNIPLFCLQKLLVCYIHVITCIKVKKCSFVHLFFPNLFIKKYLQFKHVEFSRGATELFLEIILNKQINVNCT